MALPSSVDAHKVKASSKVLPEANADDARFLIDQKILEHETSILELKPRRNALSPISRLPHEVFCRIFQFAKEGEHTRDPLRWIKVSHVSCHWRNVALNAPSLWTNPPLAHLRWTEEMLKRSQTASLTIKADLAHSLVLLGLELTLMHHMERVKHFTVHYESTTSSGCSAIRYIVSNLPRSAPRLESLCLALSLPFMSSNAPVFKLPEQALCETDRLRQLELMECDVSWDLSLFSSLTHLKLCDVSRPSTTQFFNMLKRTPDLESLDLCRCLPVGGGAQKGPLSGNPTIHLASLQSLVLCDSVLAMEQLLPRISIPHAARVGITCGGEEPPRGDFANFFATFSAMRSSSKGHGPHIRTLVVRALISKDVLVQAFSDVISRKEMEYGVTKPHLEISLSCHSMRETLADTEKVVATICSNLPLENLIELQLSFAYPFSSRTLADTFGALPQLQSIHISGNITAKPFLQALTEKPTVQVMSSSQIHALTFPHLSSIEVRSVDFDGYDAHTLVTFDSLQDCLMERYERGAEVRELSLQSCPRLSAENVNSLRHIVIDVKWDGLEIGISHEEEEEEEEEEEFHAAHYQYIDNYSSDDDSMFPSGFY